MPGTMTPGVPPPGDYVSRVTNKVTDDGNELTNQQEVREAIDRVQAKYPDQDIKKYFNVAVATCTPIFKEEDIYSAPRVSELANSPIILTCAAHNNRISTPGIKVDKVNFITPEQQEDIARNTHPIPETTAELQKLFHAVAYLNNENVIHTDAHFGNIAWMGDHIVMHDWGRAAIGIKGFKNFVKRWGLRDLATRLRRSAYSQFRGPCSILETCPIDLKDDSTSHRFMKFYDVASLAAGAEQYKFLKPAAVLAFGKEMEAAWKTESIPTNEIMLKVHESIDRMFAYVDPPSTPPLSFVSTPTPAPKEPSFPTYVPVSQQPASPPAPVPLPELSSISDIIEWEDWIPNNQYRRVHLRLRDKPIETKVTVRVLFATVGWAGFELDLPAQAALIAARYPVRSEFVGMEPPGIMMRKAPGLRRDALHTLLIPIKFLEDKTVIMEDAPYSEVVSIRRGGARKLNQTQRFCKCIKKVAKKVKTQKGPIAICVKSVLQKKGRTLKRFSCGRKGRVITQRALH
jgi:hypothetical protein